MLYRILAISPGVLYTKVAIYHNERAIFLNTINHTKEELSQFETIIDQFAFRKEKIIENVKNNNFSLSNIDVVVAKGGLLKPIESGIYTVNEQMIEDIKNLNDAEHISNLGAVIGKEIADEQKIKAYVVNPIVVDELQDIARYSGMKTIPRKSIFHALNNKSVTRRICQEMGKEYEECNFIVAHLGRGTSVAAHQKGRVIDVNNSLDGEGAMSLERSGTVPPGQLIRMCFSGEYTQKELLEQVKGDGGLTAYLGTSDYTEIAKWVEEGDEEAIKIVRVMAYQVAKEIGAYATVLKGDFDAIILTGRLCYIDLLVRKIMERTLFLGKVLIAYGEDEMSSLVESGMRLMKKEEKAKEY